MIDSVTSDGANAIMEFARTGEFSVRKMVDAMINDLLRLSLQQAATSLAGGLKNVLGVAVTAIGGFLTSAKGNIFDMGDVVPFAKGGVVAKQVMFPMGRGFGTMGEAGPEAVMPLTRTATGELGVRADVRGDGEAQAVNNYFVINSPDAEGFDRLCQRNAVSIVRATNSALEKNVGRNQMKGLLSG
jgi:lambda family phage tail tape measure protein